MVREKVYLVHNYVSVNRYEYYEVNWDTKKVLPIYIRAIAIPNQ